MLPTIVTRFVALAHNIAHYRVLMSMTFINALDGSLYFAIMAFCNVVLCMFFRVLVARTGNYDENAV